MAGSADANSPGTASRILESAERLLQVRSYNGFSYGDIAMELGITRARAPLPLRRQGGAGAVTGLALRHPFSAALAELDATAPDASANMRGYVAL